MSYCHVLYGYTDARAQTGPKHSDNLTYDFFHQCIMWAWGVRFGRDPTHFLSPPPSYPYLASPARAPTWKHTVATLLSSWPSTRTWPGGTGWVQGKQAD